MWTYEKRLQFPVNIKTTCPKTASLIISQFGGPDGEPVSYTHLDVYKRQPRARTFFPDKKAFLCQIFNHLYRLFKLLTGRRHNHKPVPVVHLSLIHI